MKRVFLTDREVKEQIAKRKESGGFVPNIPDSRLPTEIKININDRSRVFIKK